jgi:hypothetical protein
MDIHELEVKNAHRLACVKYGATNSEGWLRAGNDFICDGHAAPEQEFFPPASSE